MAKDKKTTTKKTESVKKTNGVKKTKGSKKPKVGPLKIATVKKQIKIGANNKEARIGDDVGKIAVSATLELLEHLGKCVREKLEVQKKKTVNIDVLAECISTKELAVYGLTTHGLRDYSSTGRTSVPVTAVRTCFGRGCPLRQGDFRIEKDTRRALALITEDYLRGLGRDAWILASHAGRITVKEEDINAVLCIRSNMCKLLMTSV